jgi:hypothetical protein
VAGRFPVKPNEAELVQVIFMKSVLPLLMTSAEGIVTVV